MQGSLLRAALAFSAMLIYLPTAWRRSRLRRAVRDLPTPMQRLLGPEPMYEPPTGTLPEGLRAYAALYRRTARVQFVFWGLAALWLAYVAYSAFEGRVQ